MKDLRDLLERAVAAHEQGRHLDAFRLFREGADLGDVDMINWLGTLHESGLGTKQNRAVALKLYMLAWRKRNCSSVANNIGDWHENAGNVRQAKAWFRKAILLGDGDANVRLARLLLSGRSRQAAAEILLIQATQSSRITECGKKEARELLARLNSPESSH